MNVFKHQLTQSPQSFFSRFESLSDDAIAITLAEWVILSDDALSPELSLPLQEQLQKIASRKKFILEKFTAYLNELHPTLETTKPLAAQFKVLLTQ